MKSKKIDITDVFQDLFQNIRNDFFPRWDKDNIWRLNFDPYLPAIARCMNKEKVIIFQSIREPNEEFDQLLIHEIAHAVTNDRHGKKWQNRFLNAAKKAESLGRKSLAKSIREEVKLYQAMAQPMNAKMIYEAIQDTVWESEGKASYDTVIAHVIVGLYPDEIERRYKKCRRVYDEALKDCMEYFEEKDEYDEL